MALEVEQQSLKQSLMFTFRVNYQYKEKNFKKWFYFEGYHWDNTSTSSATLSLFHYLH